MLLLHVADKGAVDVVGKQHRVDSLLTEQVDILALLLLVGHVENRVLVLLLILLQTVRKGQILAVQILEQDIISHLLCKFLILNIPEFDERCNIIPIFFIIFTVRLAHAGQLVRHLLGDIVGNLLHKAVVLQRASGHVKRQIRAVDHTLEQHQELRNHLFDVVRDKHLIVVQLDGALQAVVLHVDLGEIQDAL